MSQNLKRQPLPPNPWRVRGPGFIEFHALINLLDAPCLLVDRLQGIILDANNAFFYLTEYLPNALISHHLTEFLPDIQLHQLQSNNLTPLTLISPRSEAITIQARSIPLDSNEIWHILMIYPDSAQTIGDGNSSFDKLFIALNTLTNLNNSPDLPTAIQHALKSAAQLTGAPYIGIYQAETTIPRLFLLNYYAVQHKNIFPEHLPSTNLIKLNQPTVWTPGKRLNADLHRHARMLDLTYLASAPLGHQSALMGLLVVAGDHHPPQHDLISMVEFFAKVITTTFEHFILINNLNQSLQSQQEHHELHDTIFESTPEGIIVLDPTRSIIDMNPSAELLLGYALDEVRGNPAENILIGTESLLPALRSAQQGVPYSHSGAIKLHHRLGQPFVANLQAIPVVHNDQVTGIIILIQDVSENEQIRLQTQQLQQRAVLGEFAAIFAHEVRNPINNISTGLQLMAMSLPPGDPNLDTVTRLQNECGRLLHLMESVLSFSRPLEMKMERIELPTFLKRINDRWQPRFSRAKIESYLKIQPDLPSIMGDSRALEQVFTNLLSNSVNAMDEQGGSISIQASLQNPQTEPPQIEITVSDSGPGIPEEIRDRIFEPFVTTSRKGTGLGLAITKRIITAHKGSITVESFPGGTMFHIFLPISGGDL